MKTVKIGFVGCGAISGIYLENITNLYRDIEVIGVCDLIPERAQAAVEKYRIPKLYADMYELFADPEVDIVLNITRPYQHYDVSMAKEKGLLRSGKERREIAIESRMTPRAPMKTANLPGVLEG